MPILLRGVMNAAFVLLILLGMLQDHTPIPVAGPFDHIGVNFIKFPKSKKGNQYTTVFVDYLAKWPEVFATKDQNSVTVVKLLVEHIISRHGVSGELLSDRGKSFLSNLMYCLMVIKKVRSIAYHPQTNGLVEGLTGC